MAFPDRNPATRADRALPPTPNTPPVARWVGNGDRAWLMPARADTPAGWEQVAWAILTMLGERHLDAARAEPWLKTLVDYADEARR